MSHKKKRKLEREELEDLTSGSIIELDNFRANQSMDLGRTAVLLEYLSETLSHDRENGRIKQPSCHLLLIMSEREHVKPKGHMGTLFKHATIALKNYAKFVLRSFTERRTVESYVVRRYSQFTSSGYSKHSMAHSS